MAKITKNHVASGTLSTNPSAWIVSSNDRGRKSIKNGNVYLKDGEEFEIELFNPLLISVLADIKLNGQSISKTGLVIKPGQRFYLDCFIDDNKKFLFNTYDVYNTEEVNEAIKNNGLLEVFFYKESVISLENWKKSFDRVIVERYPIYYPSYPSYPWYQPSVYYGTSQNGIGVCTTNLGSTCNVNTSIGDVTFSSTGNELFNSSSIETGRVEKGDTSKQKFKEVDMDFDSFYIVSTRVQILPESRKPIETKDIKKIKNESYSVIDLISKLGDLHSSGILTDKEFNSKKEELLSKI